jgi:hypothetical protein
MPIVSRRAFIGSAMAAVVAAPLPRPARAGAGYDVVVYGATPGGIAAAYAAAQLGKQVALIYGPDDFGGMCANGLSRTDLDTTAVIGGFPKLFFAEVSARLGLKPQVNLLPDAARAVFASLVSEAGVETIPSGLLQTVAKDGSRIAGLTLDTGNTIAGSVFVDASYAGDLLKLSGIPWTYGREATSKYDELFAGWGNAPLSIEIPDYGSTLPAGLFDYPKDMVAGAADTRVQAYCFRLCLSDDASNTVPWAPPPGYDADEFVLGLAMLSRGEIFQPSTLFDHYFDLNFDILGASLNYPLADPARRRRIWQEHYRRQAGQLYFFATDPRVPASYRDTINLYGLAKDQFVTSRNWPKQLYIRECIRMIGTQVMIEPDVRQNIEKPDSIGMGDYGLDAHFTGAYRSSPHVAVLEGNVASGSGHETQPYQIPYGSLHGSHHQCCNLLVPVCASFSHVAYASFRMEIQYMIAGQAAGTAAALAPNGDVTRADIPSLQSELLKQGAILSL